MYHLDKAIKILKENPDENVIVCVIGEDEGFKYYYENEYELNCEEPDGTFYGVPIKSLSEQVINQLYTVVED